MRTERREDRQTDRHDEVNNRFSQFWQKVHNLFSKTLEESLLERQERKWKGDICVWKLNKRGLRTWSFSARYRCPLRTVKLS